MKKIILGLLLLPAISGYSQDGWNWPTDKAMFDKAQEMQAYYKVLMSADNYEEAMKPLNWLFEKNADLNPSIYIDGTKCVEEVMKNVTDATRLTQLQDSALWMYDMRIKHFGNEASVLDRKAYTAFKYFYKTPKRYPQLIEMYEKAFELNGAGISSFNLIPYMTVAKYGYDWKLKEMPAEKVLDIHQTLSNVMDEKQKAGEDMTDKRDKVDALFASLEGLVTCDFIKNNLAPRLKADPSDLGTAKKVFNYSLQAKCSDQPYFLQAAETIMKNDPSYQLAKILGDKWAAEGNHAKAMEFYGKALKLAANDQDKYDLLISQARIASKMGQKSKARDFANQALTVKPGSSEAYEFIGNLYMTSFEECAGKEDIVKDRAVFIAAYEMYKKAGNQERMAAAKEQFPSAEEIFTRNSKEGDEIVVGCWINEKVTIQKR